MKEWETLNSMVPLWQRPKSEVTTEEYNTFYKEKFGDWEDPLAVVHVSAEGQVEYKALLFIPAHAPFNYYSRDYEKGLQLYSSGVLIMENCADLLALENPIYINIDRLDETTRKITITRPGA